MSVTLKVLQVFPAGRRTTNPYLVMLAESLRNVDGVTVSNFTWRTALLSRYDVVHLHWPENLGSGHSPVKRLVRQALTVLLVAKWKIAGTAVVRTLHNVHLPTGISRREKCLLRMIERVTGHFITLNIHTPVPPGRASTLIPHGHYRNWFSQIPRQSVIAGQFGFAGLIRGYKGVEQLIASYRSIERPELSLLIAGNPSSPELVEEIRRSAGEAENIHVDLRFLPDEDLVRAISTSELVVLPYRFMHNSGGVLASLSLDRPVLVPRNAVNSDLAAEVGQGWMHLFDDELDGQDLERSLNAVRSNPPITSPDLSAREWKDTGPRHIAAYTLAAAGVRRRGRRLFGTGSAK